MYLIIFVVYLLMLLIVNLISSTVITRTLLLLTPLLLIFSVVFTFWEAKGGIDVRMKTGGSTQRGKSSKLHIDVRGNRILLGTVTTMWLTVENSLSGETMRKKLRIYIPGRKNGSLDLDLTCAHSGKLRIRLEQAGLYDLFGLIPVKSRISSVTGEGEAVVNVSVLPELFDCEIGYHLHESLMYDTDAYSQTRKGMDPSEVFQIREYVPGDQLKSIHWKLSSKHDQMVVREGSFPIDKSILVVFDKSVIPGSGLTVDGALTDACIDMTVSVARGLLEMGLAHQLIYNSVEENYCYVADIGSEDELFAQIPGLMTGGVKENAMSCGKTYMGLETGTPPGHVIYISINDATDAPEQFPMSKVIELQAVKDVYRDLYAQIDL